MQEVVCNLQLWDGRADSATGTKIASAVTGGTVGPCTSDEDTGDTCLYNAIQPHV